MHAYMYIILCSNGTYYTGSTKNLERRFAQHQAGEGANYTKKHAPIELVYFEKFDRIDSAFNREHQIKKWSQKKKKALINGKLEQLHEFAKCRNSTTSDGFDSAQPSEDATTFNN